MDRKSAHYIGGSSNNVLSPFCHHRVIISVFLKVRRIPIYAEDGIIMDYAPQDESGPSGNPGWLG